ncbi:hypothetical protein DAPPUDRAFT_60708 [Daphnia pulex]|uniref:Dynein heavy chain coiled coil stalk domain-containing protein n=1 Tax=Daphnia pulex TaxID=6669 RepID=E9HBB2_DAPPU|nr:hypothetical protein DAPPUDRAFT_68451 [Daphnia pulex]EFX70939.1 hypothetical protein DAPPUDRAFT_60708 [Daphnia pulex]|eukprot:EFX61941.1 hypothetical protein DAPPUDRAFT_68451 [Daphnia pulex]
MAQHSSAAYLELLSNFRTLWLSKEKDLLQQKERYNVGLGKLQFAASQVVVMQEELRSLQPQLVDTSAETESLMVKIEQDTVKVEAQKEIIAADESLANEAAAAAQAIKDECESDLAEATPALDAAINALDTLKPADITLVKSMRHPPSIVKLLDMGTGKITDNYWQAAPKILGDLRFLDLLRSYDKDNIPTNVMKSIREKYIPNPEFNPNIVRHVSTACEGLCRWVRAMEVYDRVIKIVAPDWNNLTLI